MSSSLETGSWPEIDGLEEDVRTIVMAQLRPDRARASQLRGDAPLTFASLWPGIRLLTTWTGGSCGVALDRLRQTLPAGAKVMELGYQSTECRGTIALEAETSGGLPPLHHHFFEFVEQQDWDRGQQAFLGLEELVLGKRYYVLVTTAAGLYRYFMNDLVEVTGHYRNTPLLKFVQKGKGVTSLTGEKLYEAQVIEAVQGSVRGRAFAARFFVLVADEERCVYSLFLEGSAPISSTGVDIAADVDPRLGELNIEYRSERASGRLAPLTIAWLRQGSGEAYKDACVRSGQREGQFKPVLLQYRSKLPLPFEPYVIG